MGKSIEFTKEQIEFMIYNYVVLKRGVNAIGKDLGGVSGKTIQTHLKKHGIKLRTLTEAMQEQRSWNVNDNYFKTQSHNMAYILGFLAADGCVQKTNHIVIDLQEHDEEILYKIKEEIKFTGPIEHYTNNSGHKYSRLRICSAEIKKDLIHYGLTEKKTYTLQPPVFLNNEYHISYIRGYFDGDGCIYYNENNLNKYEWNICGAKKEMLEWMRTVLVNQYGIISNVEVSSKTLKMGDPFYVLHIYTCNMICNLFQILYIPDTLYLNRKFQKFKNFYDIKSTRPYSSRDEEKRYAELIQIQE